MNDASKPPEKHFEDKLIHAMDPNTWFGFFNRKKKREPGDIEYAGFQDRAFASALDIGLTMILFYKLFFFVAILIFGEERASQLYTIHVHTTPEQLKAMVSLPGYWRDNLINSLLQIAILGGLFITSWYKTGMSPGKWLIRIRIVDEPTGKRPSKRQAIIRFLVSLIAALPLGLGFFSIIWHKKKQGWHDRAAGTAVIKVKHWRLMPPEISEYPSDAIAPDEENHKTAAEQPSPKKDS